MRTLVLSGKVGPAFRTVEQVANTQWPIIGSASALDVSGNGVVVQSIHDECATLFPQVIENVARVASLLDYR